MPVRTIQYSARYSKHAVVYDDTRQYGPLITYHVGGSVTNDNNRLAKLIGVHNRVEKRIYCVRCGRVAFYRFGKFACLGGHWLSTTAVKPGTAVEENLPATWNDAGMCDPGLTMPEKDSLFCFVCGQQAYPINDQRRHECKNGHVMDYNL